MEQDLSAWVTIPEAVEATGKGRRTIERLVEKQLIRTAKRKVDGRKPVTVIASEEIEKLKAETLRPVVQPATPPALQPATPPLRHPDTVAVLKAIEKLLVPLSQKLYLSEREAALYLGFPRAELVRLVDQGVIPSTRLTNRQRRIRRADLEAYASNPPREQVAA